MRPATLYLALVYLHPGQREALRHYESLVRPIFHRHGGGFDRILRPLADGADHDAGDVDTPDEIHLLRFETPDGLAAVRGDPEMVALVPLRGRAVRKALLLPVEDVPLDRYFASRS
jgi:hypothetical protein